MPELPEMEAWRRQLNDPVSAFPIEKAGPAHVATLKTFDPPLATLEGRRLAGAERRAKRLLFPTEDGELVVLVHLMTAGRLRYLLAGEKGPKTPAFQLDVRGRRATRPDGGRLEEARRRVAADAGAGRGRARAPRPGGARARRRPAGGDLRRRVATAALAPAQPEADRRHRPRVGERDPPRGKLSPYALAPDLSREEVERLATAIDTELARGLALREQGAKDDKAYRVHKKLAAPCDVCATPIAQVDFEEHTIYYCPQCQTGGRVLKDRRMSRLLR